MANERSGLPPHCAKAAKPGEARPKTWDTPPLRSNFLPQSDEPAGISAFWHVKGGAGRAWLDLQNDVTDKDIKVSLQEGFQRPEHVKRYTTLGMATDQGKTANVPAIGANGRAYRQINPGNRNDGLQAALHTGSNRRFRRTIPRISNFRPVRLTPSHNWAKSRGAIFVEAGNWMRAQWYPVSGESHWRESVDREVNATRNSVGVCDVSSLGKIDIQGRDAKEFLNRVYANGFSTLAVGKVRYGLMLREDGIVYDDGTTACLATNHFVMTTTTANAGLVFSRLEFARQCLWPETRRSLDFSHGRMGAIFRCRPEFQGLAARCH